MKSVSKFANFLKVVLSLVFVLAGGYAVYYALNLENPSVCQDGSCDVKQVVPGKLSSYSWQDLSFIANRIENAPDKETRLTIAKHYNLLDENNHLTKDIISFQASDGTEIEVRLAGIAADDDSGLSFVTANAPYYHKVNTKDTTEGSWKESYVREWLNGEVLSTLPQDLQAVIKPVKKFTCNADAGGVASGTIDSSIDKLWLLSVSEICGDVDWFQARYNHRNMANLDKTMSYQGGQYQCFSDNGVRSDKDPEGYLKMKYGGQSVSWWMRSPYIFKLDAMESNFWFDVTSEGYTFNYLGPSRDSGIVFGFAL